MKFHVISKWKTLHAWKITYSLFHPWNNSFKVCSSSIVHLNSMMEHPWNIVHVFEWINLHSYFCGWNFTTFRIKWSSCTKYHLHYYFIHKIYFIHSSFTFNKIQHICWMNINEISFVNFQWTNLVEWIIFHELSRWIKNNAYFFPIFHSQKFIQIAFKKFHPWYIIIQHGI